MSFHEVVFPENISVGAICAIERQVERVQFRNGNSALNFPWKRPKRTYSFATGNHNLVDLRVVQDFFEAREGMKHGFRWKDWMDFKSCDVSQNLKNTDQIIGSGDGVSTEFQLRKYYGDTLHGYSRSITKLVAGTVKLARDKNDLVEGVDFSIDHDTGIVSFTEAPESEAVISAGFEFYVPVRFSVSQIEVNLQSETHGDISNLEVEEIFGE